MSPDEMWTDSEREADPIPEPTFGTVRRGYDPDEVSTYVKTMTTRVRSLEHRAAELESELKQARHLAPEDAGSAGDPYAAISGRMADAVRAFDQDVEQMRGEAEAEAKRILDEARADADRIRVEARSTAEKTLKESRARADARLSELESRRRSLMNDLRTVRERMLESVSSLDPILNVEGAAQKVVIPEEGIRTP